MSHSQECPVCKEKLFLPTAPKVNLVLKEIIESKYPSLISQMKAQKEASEVPSHLAAGSDNAGGHLIKCFGIVANGAHLLPKEHMVLSGLDRAQLEDFAAIFQITNRCVVVSGPVREGEGENYGCIVELDFARIRRSQLSVLGQVRVRIRSITEEMIEAIGKPLKTCDVEPIEDELPAEEAGKLELIGYAQQVYGEFAQKLGGLPEVVRNDVRSRYDAEPFISETAGTAAKAKFVEQLSLYMASTLGAAHKNPAILYVKSSEERLRWIKRIIEEDRNRGELFRNRDTKGGIKAIVQFVAFFVVCIGILLAARFSRDY